MYSSRCMARACVERSTSWRSWRSMGPTSARRHLAALSALLVQVPSQESGYRLGNNCSAPCEPSGQMRLGETTLMLRAIVETILMVSVDLGGTGCDARAATPLARR